MALTKMTCYGSDWLTSVEVNQLLFSGWCYRDDEVLKLAFPCAMTKAIFCLMLILYPALGGWDKGDCFGEGGRWDFSAWRSTATILPRGAEGSGNGKGKGKWANLQNIDCHLLYLNQKPDILRSCMALFSKLMALEFKFYYEILKIGLVAKASRQ